MPDRRKSSKGLWAMFQRLLHGERRSGKERRNPGRMQLLTAILLEGCGGDCQQGDYPCNCHLNRNDHAPQKDN